MEGRGGVLWVGGCRCEAMMGVCLRESGRRRRGVFLGACGFLCVWVRWRGACCECRGVVGSAGVVVLLALLGLCRCLRPPKNEGGNAAQRNDASKRPCPCELRPWQACTATSLGTTTRLSRCCGSGWGHALSFRPRAKGSLHPTTTSIIINCHQAGTACLQPFPSTHSRQARRSRSSSTSSTHGDPFRVADAAGRHQRPDCQGKK